MNVYKLSFKQGSVFIESHTAWTALKAVMDRFNRFDALAADRFEDLDKHVTIEQLCEIDWCVEDIEKP